METSIVMELELVKWSSRRFSLRALVQHSDELNSITGSIMSVVMRNKLFSFLISKTVFHIHMSCVLTEHSKTLWKMKYTPQKYSCKKTFYGTLSENTTYRFWNMCKLHWNKCQVVWSHVFQSQQSISGELWWSVTLPFFSFHTEMHTKTTRFAFLHITITEKEQKEENKRSVLQRNAISVMQGVSSDARASGAMWM